MKLFLALTLAIIGASPAHAGWKKEKDYFKALDKYFDGQDEKRAKFEAKAKAREPVVGMPHAVFLLMSDWWDCKENVTYLSDTYQDQFVCAGAFSKKHELQGKYFYTAGPWREYQGSKVLLGTVSAIQNQ